MENTDPDLMLMTSEVLALLHVTRQTLHRWDKSGRLRPAVRGSFACPHLYRRSEVEALRRQAHAEGRPARLSRSDLVRQSIRLAVQMFAPDANKADVESFLAQLRLTR